MRRFGLSMRAALLAAAILASRTASADSDVETNASPVETHAFVSQGFILSKSNNFLSEDTTRGSFRFTEVGINFTKQVTDKLRVGIQLFAHDIGATGTFDAKVDWFYLDYRFADWLGVRAGRVKVPFGLYNEINDIDSARVPILLPQSVYPIENRDYLLAQTGGEIYGYIRSEAMGGLEYRAYAGTILFDTQTPAGSPYQVLTFNVPYVAGGRLLWETPLEGLRLGGSVQTLRLDASFLINAATTVDIKIPVVLAVASAEYSAHDLLLAAEYSRWLVSTHSTDAAVLPEGEVTSERAYGMASYRVSRWFQPGAYYSILFPDIEHRTGSRDRVQHDVALTLRYDLMSNWLLKLESHYMAGTAGVDPTLNGNVPLDTLARNWGVFLVKTTAFF